MARTRKAIQPLNLSSYEVLIEDNLSKSEYFKVSQFDGYFYGGRNAFLIAGSTELKAGTEVLVEILNSEGTTVYSAPISQFVEGSSQLIQVEVYRDTPIGNGKIVIMGCAETYADGTPVPLEWRDTFNVRWTSDVIISPLVQNRTTIRLATKPAIDVKEKFYFEPSSSVFTQKIQVPIDISITPKYFNVYQNGYTMRAIGPVSTSRYFAEYLNGVVTGSFVHPNGTASVQLPITRIYNKRIAESVGSLIYVGNTDDDILTSAEITGLNIEYDLLISENTGSAISFADIRLVDMETLSGEIHKVKFSYKKATDPGQFKLLGEILTDTSELLTIDSGSKIINSGKFRQIVIPDYWYAETMSISKSDIVKNPPQYYLTSSLVTNQNIKQNCYYLLDSINATPNIVLNNFENNASYFIGTKENNAISLFTGSEYTLSFNALVTRASASVELLQSDYSMEIYLVPIENSSRLLETNQMGQLLGTLTPQTYFQSENFDTVELNFIPKINQQGLFGLRFVVYGGFWNIANVSLKAADEPMFSPDEIRVLLPNTEYRDSLVVFKAEFLDIDNNSILDFAESVPVYFTGSDAGSSGTALGMRNGVASSASFGGAPYTASITFGTPYPNTDYAVVLSGEDVRVWSIQNKTPSGFEINTNSNVPLLYDVDWITVVYGES